jgi:serine protease Do
VTAGIISAVGRSPEGTDNVSTFVDYLQTDASINPGNSGGGLFNIAGELVGINTWIASQTGGSIGLGFAIPVNLIQKAITDFVRVGKVVYGWLGVQIADDKLQYYQSMAQSLNTTAKKGGLVLNVFIGSPADKSGILPGDFITSIGEEEIQDSNHLTRVVGMLSAGQTIDFSLIRYSQELAISARVEARAEETQIQANNNLWPGMILFPINDDLRKQYSIGRAVNGTFIAQIIEGSPAGAAGFQVGDVVVRIANTKVNTLIDFYRTINQSKGDLTFRVWRQGQEVPVVLAKKRY